MEMKDLFEQARDAITVRRVFGEPVERNGVVVVPAAAVRGGGGGGSGQEPGAPGGPTGSGGGFGVSARPVGAYVIRGDRVEWQPALDVGRIALAGLGVAALAIWALRAAGKRRTTQAR